MNKGVEKRNGRLGAILSRFQGWIWWVGCLLTLVGTLGADRPHVVIIQGESEYGSVRTMPALASQLEKRLDVRTTILQADEAEQGPLPNLDVLDDADLLILYIRFKMATDAQFARLKTWFDAGKPAVAFRTTSHGFWENKGWFVPFFGGHYKAHAPNGSGTEVIVPVEVRDHPVMRGVDPSFQVGYGGTYNAQPLSDFVTPLLLGKTQDLPAEPVAWIAEYRPRQRLFYTSLGGEDNFDSVPFRNLVLNAISWGLGEEIPSGGVLRRDVSIEAISKAVVAAPVIPIDDGETLLMPGGDLSRWNHWDPSVEPRAIGIDQRADTSSGGETYSSARWKSDGMAVVARPGFGDIVTRESFENGVYKIDFLIPHESKEMPLRFRGNSGVFVDGKWEIQIIDSFGRSELDARYTCGSIFGHTAPMVNACKAPGVWQSMEIVVRHTLKGANLSVWLNGQRIHDQVEVAEPTLYGFGSDGDDEGDEDSEEGGEPNRFVIYNEEASAQLNLARDFTVTTRFRTVDDGPLWAKVDPSGKLGQNDRVLHISDGLLRFEIGSVGSISSRRRVDDCEWHDVILSSESGVVHLSLDGEKEATLKEARLPDNNRSRLTLGFATDDFPRDDNDDLVRWQGEIDRFEFFPRG